MKYILSKHAIEQAKIRSIPEKIIKDIIEKPDKIIEYNQCIKIYQSLIKIEKAYLFRVFINTCKEPYIVITVYKTSKIEKYHES